jgi:hypothetical protein
MNELDYILEKLELMQLYAIQQKVARAIQAKEQEMEISDLDKAQLKHRALHDELKKIDK